MSWQRRREEPPALHLGPDPDLAPHGGSKGTLNHPVARQVEILWDWAQRMEQEGEGIRTIEILERLLLLAPQHASALAWLSSLLRGQGMVEEMLGITERLLAIQPDNLEAKLRRGEALLHLEGTWKPWTPSRLSSRPAPCTPWPIWSGSSSQLCGREPLSPPGRSYGAQSGNGPVCTSGNF